jgi:hypothetical protein
MRIGVISDTHIPISAKEIPKVVYEVFRGVDLILHAGDLVEISVLRELKKMAEVKAVVGNMDSSEVIQVLPKREIIEINNFRIGLVHGYGPPIGLEKRVRSEFEDKIDIIVYGHSHHPENKTKDGILFFNPGSPTDKIFSPYNSYGIIQIDDKINAEIIKV